MRSRRPYDRRRPHPARVGMVGSWPLSLRRDPAPPYSRPITRRTVFGALMLAGGPPPISAARVAAALTLFPRPRHVARAALCMAALARRGMVPEELVGGGPH